MIIGTSCHIGSGKDLAGQIIQYLVWRNKVEKRKTIKLDYTFEEFCKSRYGGDKLSGFVIKKFADKLKDIVCLLIGCTREQLEYREFKEKELGEEWDKYLLEEYWVNDESAQYTTRKYFNSKEEMEKYCIEMNHTDSTCRQVSTIQKMTPRLLLQILGTQCGRNIIHPNIWCTSLFTDYYGDIEIWKDIVGYEGRYQISSFGRVKGLNREIVYGDKSKGEYHTKKESILKSTLTGKYEMIKLEGNNSVTIHSLVANAFLPKIEGKNYVNHIDQNPLNNFYKNLEWCTQSENIVDANSKGNGNIGEKQYSAKLTDKDVEQIRILLKDRNYKQVDIAKRFKVCPTTISDIKHGRKWSHVGRNTCSLSHIVPQQPNWIITDVRFPNEAKAIKDRGGIIIRVNRNICKPSKHESETALDDYKGFDYVIDNNSDIQSLIEKVRNILEKENIL